MRFTVWSVAPVVLVAVGLIAAPPETPADTLVAGLGDADTKVRDASAAALKDRADALPWLRRAARADDKDTARRAAELLTAHEKRRQESVAGAIDACVRDGRVDVLTEWHQYWKPKAEADLWAVGPRATKAGLDLYAKSCPEDAWELFKKEMDRLANVKTVTHDGPYPESFPPHKVAWQIRTDRLDGTAHGSTVIRFASVAGPAKLWMTEGGRYLTLGPVEAAVGSIGGTFVAADGGISAKNGGACRTISSVVVCRGTFVGRDVGASVLLVDGDIDLTTAGALRYSLIRATGEIRLPRGVVPTDCTIEAGVKDATAPYKFFELADVGLSVAGDDGVLVTAVKDGTPFGNCGLAAGDVIRAVDDTPTKHASELRKLVRRASVRQGDCLITVSRGDKTLDLPVFFPLPK